MKISISQKKPEEWNGSILIVGILEDHIDEQIKFLANEHWTDEVKTAWNKKLQFWIN